MRNFRYVWLMVLLAGLLFVGAALASGSTATAAPEEGDNEVAMALAGDCDNESGTSASINGLPDMDLITGQSNDQACRDCHTNEEQLRELAVEEEAAESLSEGPG